MNAPVVSPAQARLNAIRNRFANASPDWTLAELRRLGMTAGSGAQQYPVLVFDEKADIADQEMIAHARDDLGWLLEAYDKLARLYRDALAEIRRLDPPQRTKDYAAECAMQCGKQSFLMFLHERHGLEAADGERVKTRVRSILRIQSRAELNTDENARQRWFSLRAEFKSWQGGR